MNDAFGEELHLNKIVILAIFLFNLVALFLLSEHGDKCFLVLKPVCRE